MANDWYGSSIETSASDNTPMVDSGTGRTLILRVFEFAINPKEKERPNKQDLFNSHWPQLRIMLWGDGLVANQDVPPKVIVGRRRYRIFILCEPKFRTMVNDKTKTLQELFKQA